MTPSHIYVYCAVRGRVSERALKRLPSLPDAAAPRTLPLDDEITLVVADVPTKTYSTDAIESRLGDLAWVAECGAAHHAVPDALVRKQVVVPFRLFTLFSSEARAIATLARRRAAIRKAADRLEGRAEFVLRIGPPDPARARKMTAAARRAEASGRSFLQAKADERRVAAERVQRVHKAAVTVFDALRARAEDAVAQPIAQGTSLLLDAAFLVPMKHEAAFKKTVAQTADGLLAEGCAVSLTGPWPAYSFVSLK